MDTVRPIRERWYAPLATHFVCPGFHLTSQNLCIFQVGGRAEVPRQAHVSAPFSLRPGAVIEADLDLGSGIELGLLGSVARVRRSKVYPPLATLCDSVSTKRAGTVIDF